MFRLLKVWYNGLIYVLYRYQFLLIEQSFMQNF